MNHLSLATPQATKISKLLAKRGPLTAKEIGRQLGILPNTVYRANKQLLNLGVIERLDVYPVRYEAVPSEAALGWFTLQARQNFQQTFGGQAKQNKAFGATLTFIKTRTDLLKKTDNDIAGAKREVNFIVSGLEVPDSTILVYRKAIASGVAMKCLVQKRQETSRAKLEKWQEIGIPIRHTNNLGIRLFVIDARVVYFTAYSEDDNEQAFGVRFDYPSLARFMNEQFIGSWKAASA